MSVLVLRVFMATATAALIGVAIHPATGRTLSAGSDTFLGLMRSTIGVEPTVTRGAIEGRRVAGSRINSQGQTNAIRAHERVTWPFAAAPFRSQLERPRAPTTEVGSLLAVLRGTAGGGSGLFLSVTQSDADSATAISYRPPEAALSHFRRGITLQNDPWVALVGALRLKDRAGGGSWSIGITRKSIALNRRIVF